VLNTDTALLANFHIAAKLRKDDESEGCNRCFVPAGIAANNICFIAR